MCLVHVRFQHAQAVDVPGALAVNGVSVQTPSLLSAMTSLMVLFL